MELEKIENNAEFVVTRLKALSNERRLIILCTLLRGEKSVGELEEIVGLSQSALSQHLARLRRDDIVTTRRDAQTIYYSLACEKMRALIQSLCNIIWSDDLPTQDS